MEFDADSIAKVAGPLLSVIVGAIAKHYTEARSRLVSYIGHVSAFTVQTDPPMVIHTHSVIVRNTGRKAATNVRLTHGVLPPNISIYPTIQHTIQANPNGSGEIIIPMLVPKEQVTVSYLYFPPLLWNQINEATKSDEGFAKIIRVIPMPQPNRWILGGVWTLMFVGASFVFYWIARFVIVAIQ